ncbi:hypothetical protein SALWKB29_1775 [Snodgrassella communis]|uniref:Uncharacterized protein n=1 Tax=Snodgrassella communis TaxID=2946699 RepID=A0A836MQD8_9NEIS|nr:hypothetical protein SALWKB29_1775 [Snodgrassella communis]
MIVNNPYQPKNCLNPIEIQAVFLFNRKHDRQTHITASLPIHPI